MNLIKAAQTKANFDELNDEDKAMVLEKSKEMREFLEQELPALSDSDRAAVAWTLATLFGKLDAVPVGKVSDLISSTCIAYGVAAVELLGWLD